MRLSLNWLKELIDIPVGPDQLAEELTMLGLEIEAIERPGAEIKEVYVGKILSIDPHPDADKLVVCKTDIGQAEPLTIVCGAKNMKPGDHVPTAIIGASLPGGFEIGRRKMRGIESQGMMCSGKELGLGDDHSGLLILDPSVKVGESILPVLGLDDVIFEIEITPNRGDWAGMIGIARELAARFGTNIRWPEVKLEETSPAASELSSVTIQNPELCSRYIGRVLTNVTVTESPAWLKNRVTAAGMRPINNIVDITNLVLLETAHPLHAFDLDKLKENRIVVREMKQGETIDTLDGQARELPEGALVIADAEHPVAIAGIMGGLHSEVTDGTTRILLESAAFNSSSIRKTAKSLGLISEASQRFQRGCDQEMAVFAANRAAYLMQQLAGAKIHLGMLDQYPGKAPKREVVLRHSRCDLLVGNLIEPERQRGYLEALGFESLETDDTKTRFPVPTWRPDVSMEADLIEEIIRLHGFANITPKVSTAGKNEIEFLPEYKPTRALRHMLLGLGLSEFTNLSFTNPADVEKAGIVGTRASMVGLMNPLAETMSHLRPALAPSILENISHNVRYGVQTVRGFEIAPVYHPVENQDLPSQQIHLAVVLAGQAEDDHWSHKARAYDFFDIKGLAETIFQHLGLQAGYETLTSPQWMPGAAATVKIDGGKSVGELGEIHPKVLKAFDIGSPVFYLELTLDEIILNGTSAPQFVELPKFPAVTRDIAVVVERALPAQRLCDLTRRAGGTLLRSVELFDLYTGEKMAADKKSVAIRFVLQSPEKTLSDDEVQKVYDKVIRTLEKEVRASQR